MDKAQAAKILDECLRFGRHPPHIAVEFCLQHLKDCIAAEAKPKPKKAAPSRTPTKEYLEARFGKAEE